MTVTRRDDYESLERSLRFMAALKDLPKCAEFLLENLPAPFKKLKRKIELGLEEQLVNILRHAYSFRGGPVRISRGIVYFDSKPALRVSIQDWGRPFNPFTDAGKPDLKSPAQERREGGLGIHLVRSFSSHCLYSRALGSNLSEFLFFPEDSKT
ncbi:MAG: ATP-binding protein [Deltaproteobacteria bacterium]|jgi:anti-sigma regulatory factor (Ser/Thr protein kinase)|nr:ATP-binding protein [Deltaproteobacteria bacterium]